MTGVDAVVKGTLDLSKQSYNVTLANSISPTFVGGKDGTHEKEICSGSQSRVR